MHDDRSPVNARLLDIKNLALRYGKFVALKDISLHVAPGEIVAVIGANGAGKSSLIKAISGAETDVMGAMAFRGQDLAGVSVPQRIRGGIGLVPEGRKIFPSLSVEENILLGAQLGAQLGDQPGSSAGAAPSTPAQKRWTLERAYDLFPELAPKRHLSGVAVSGGQQQMIAIARALATNPKLLLCDEISLGLAPLIINRLYTLLQQLAREGLAILVVEQAVRKSLEISSRYYCMLEGAISLFGDAADADEAAVGRAYFGR